VPRNKAGRFGHDEDAVDSSRRLAACPVAPRCILAVIANSRGSWNIDTCLLLPARSGSATGFVMRFGLGAWIRAALAVTMMIVWMKDDASNSPLQWAGH
jgi:hypothetical protein